MEPPYRTPPTGDPLQDIRSEGGMTMNETQVNRPQMDEAQADGDPSG